MIEWLVSRLEDTNDKIANFAALVHRVYEKKLAHHPEVTEVIATEASVETIAAPAK